MIRVVEAAWWDGYATGDLEKVELELACGHVAETQLRRAESTPKKSWCATCEACKCKGS